MIKSTKIIIMYVLTIIIYDFVLLASEYYLQESQSVLRRQLCFTGDDKNDSEDAESSKFHCGIKQRLQANMRKARYYICNYRQSMAKYYNIKVG